MVQPGQINRHAGLVEIQYDPLLGHFRRVP
jgi:hypothetical protein